MFNLYNMTFEKKKITHQRTRSKDRIEIDKTRPLYGQTMVPICFEYMNIT